MRRWIWWGLLVLGGLVALGLSVWILSSSGGFSGVQLVGALLVVVVLLTSVSPEKTQAFINRWLVPMVILVILGTSLAMAPSTRTGSIRFYEIAAQVIPTLVLALAIEIRLVRGTPRHELALVFPFTILFLLGVGEFFALKAVVTESPTRSDFQSVVSTMTGAFSGIILGALARPGDDSEPED